MGGKVDDRDPAGEYIHPLWSGWDHLESLLRLNRVSLLSYTWSSVTSRSLTDMNQGPGPLDAMILSRSSHLRTSRTR